MNQLLIDTIWWVPCYGLLGAILTLPWSVGLVRRTGPRPAAYLNMMMTILPLIHGLLVLQQIWDQPPIQLVVPWLDALDLHLEFALEISSVSVGASVLVTGLSFLAQVFAIGYMEKDWGLARFYALMGFFEGAMSGIALSNSLFLSYALLEMLTLSTYLLVGFWYAQPLVVTAARDAFLTKRIGDMLLLMGVVALMTLTGSLNFSDLSAWAQTADLAPWAAALLGLALLAGPTGKCAQFPLHLWLDEAMEGPNPASILRNSVVVACGAWVLIKLQPVLALSPIVSSTLILLGSLTAVGSSLVAIAQIDIKRTFSHTTSAYLGLVFVAVGIQQPNAALVFLLTHALAKSLLFMGIGSIILTCVTQNVTELGGLRTRMPATWAAFAIGGSSMVALLPLGSFWSMLDLVDVFLDTQPWLLVILLAVNGLTALNVIRVLGLVFEGSPKLKSRRAPEVAWPMAIPIVFMVILNLLTPLLLSTWHLLPVEWTPSLQRSTLLLVGSGLAGTIIGGIFYLDQSKPKPIDLPWKAVQDLLAYDFYVEKLYRFVVVIPVGLGARILDWFDRFIVDGLVNGIGLVLILGAEGLKYTMSGRMQLYILAIVIGTIAMGGLLLQSILNGL